MTCKLKFLPSAWMEWNKIGDVIREQFKKKLGERIVNPIVQADQLRGFKNYYKIKLRSAGYRLVYEVDRNEIVIYVITVGKRENDLIYKKVQKRTRKEQGYAVPHEPNCILRPRPPRRDGLPPRTSRHSSQ